MKDFLFYQGKSYGMCDHADQCKKTNIVPRPNSLNLGLFQLKSVLLFNSRYITDPAKSKTDSRANVYRDGRTYSKQKPGFSFWMYEMC